MPRRRPSAAKSALSAEPSPEERARAAIAKEEALPGDKVRLTSGSSLLAATLRPSVLARFEKNGMWRASSRTSWRLRSGAGPSRDRLTLVGATGQRLARNVVLPRAAEVSRVTWTKEIEANMPFGRSGVRRGARLVQPAIGTKSFAVYSRRRLQFCPHSGGPPCGNPS